jgi:hypothetical protein
MIPLLVLLVTTWDVAPFTETALDTLPNELMVRVPASSDQLPALGALGLSLDDLRDGYAWGVTSQEDARAMALAGWRPELLLGEMRSVRAALAETEGYRDYHSYAELTADLQGLEAAYPTLCSLHELGTAHAPSARKIWGLKVSVNPSSHELEPEVRLIGAYHGDERISVEVPLHIAHYLLENYGSVQEVTDILDSTEVWIVPMFNPDGVESGSRYNYRGVDLNRNHGYMWGDAACGSHPHSENETSAIRENALDHNFALSLSFHSGAEYVNYLWNYTPVRAPDQNLLLSYSNAYASHTGYAVTEGYDWYQTKGDCNDWSYGCNGDLDWTIELSYQKTPPASQIQPICDLNRPAILQFIEETRQGICGTVTDASTGTAIQAMVTTDECDWPVFTQMPLGDYHRALLPGTYTVRAWANGYQQTSVSEVEVAAGQRTRLDISLSPLPYYYATRVVIANSPDYSGHSYPYPTHGHASLGPIDGVGFSLGSTSGSGENAGYVVLDMGADTPVQNWPGYDIRIVEAAIDLDEPYTVLAGQDPDGPWTSVGAGTGTAEFDLTGTGVLVARYIRLEVPSGANGSYPGFDLDAVQALRPIDGPYVAYVSHAVDDDTTGDSQGDGDGLPEPGERIELLVELANIGSAAAPGVEAILRCTDPWVTLIDTIEQYGDMSPGDTLESGDDFDLSLAPGIPDGHQVACELHVTSAGSLWVSGFPITVCAPVLVFKRCDVDDASGNGNARLDPGETVGLSLLLENQGAGDAATVQVSLATSDAYLGVVSGSAMYPDLLPDSSGANLTAFVVTAVDTCPEGHVGTLLLTVQAAGGYQEDLAFALTVGHPTVLVVDSDSEPTETRLMEAMALSGYSYDTWDAIAQGPVPLDTLQSYMAIVWTAGDNNTSSMSATDRQNMGQYLDQGGSLLFSGENYLSAYGSDPFTSTYLHIASYTTNVSLDSVKGVAGDPITHGMSLGTDFPPDMSVAPDRIVPDAQATGILTIDLSSDYTALRYPGGGPAAYRCVYMATPVEALATGQPNPSNPKTYVRNCLDWLLGAPDTMAPDGVADLAIHLGSPATSAVLSWSEPWDNVGVTHYRVYCDTAAYLAPAPSALVATVSLPMWTHAGGAGDPAANHYYTVTALDAADNESVASNVVGAFTSTTQGAVSVHAPVQERGAAATRTRNTYKE